MECHEGFDCSGDSNCDLFDPLIGGHHTFGKGHISRHPKKFGQSCQVFSFFLMFFFPISKSPIEDNRAKKNGFRDLRS